MEPKEEYIDSELQVYPLDQRDSSVSIQALCTNRTVVLKMFGRFGCPLTRSEADMLNHQKSKLAAMGACLVGVGFEAEQEFTHRGIWDGEMYLDPDRHLYSSLHLHRLTKFQAIRGLMSKQTRGRYFTCQKKFGGTLTGDTRQTGGTFVLNCLGRILYACPQSEVGAVSDLEKVLQVCKKEFLQDIFRSDPIFSKLKENDTSPPTPDGPTDHFDEASTTSIECLSSISVRNLKKAN